MSEYAFISNLAAEVQVPSRGILSRTLLNDDRVRIVLFAFAVGEELSAHTAPMPAILYFVQGDARVQLGTDTVEATAGSLVHMPANLAHGIRPRTPVIMLLIMMKEQKTTPPQPKEG